MIEPLTHFQVELVARWVENPFEELQAEVSAFHPVVRYFENPSETSAPSLLLHIHAARESSCICSVLSIQVSGLKFDLTSHFIKDAGGHVFQTIEEIQRFAGVRQSPRGPSYSFWQVPQAQDLLLIIIITLYLFRRCCPMQQWLSSWMSTQKVLLLSSLHHPPTTCVK